MLSRGPIHQPSYDELGQVVEHGQHASGIINHVTVTGIGPKGVVKAAYTLYHPPVIEIGELSPPLW